MAISLGSAILFLNADPRPLNKALGQAKAQSQREFGNIANSARQVGYAMTAMGAGIIGGLGLSVKAAVDFESAFAGVRKTVDATEPEFAKLKQGFIDLSMEVPRSAAELARIGEIAGQMGIKKEHIIQFTKTIAMLADTTDIAGEAGAAMLSQFINITGTPQDDIDSLGSAIVALGNDSNATEAQILEMAHRIAAAGTIAGMTEGDILGISSAMVSVGINAEAGGSSISRAINDMNSAVIGFSPELGDFAKKVNLSTEQLVEMSNKGGKAFMELAKAQGMSVTELKKWIKEQVKGGEDLQAFADVAGMSAEKFAAMWRDEPVQAVVAFIKGLNDMRLGGEDVVKALNSTGLEGIRLALTFQNATLANEMFASQIKLGNEAMRENTAMSEEAAKRYETVAAQLQILKNTFIAGAIAIGDVFLPRIIQFVDFVKPMVQEILAWVKSHQQLTEKLALGAAALGGFLLVLGPLLVMLPGLAVAFNMIAAVAAVVSAKFILIGAAIVGGLVAAFYILKPTIEAARGWIAANWDQITRIFGLAVDGIVINLKIFGEIIKQVLSIAAAILKGFGLGVSESFSTAVGATDDGTTSMLDMIEWLLNASNQIFSMILEGVQKFSAWLDKYWDDIVGGVQWAVENILKPLATLLGWIVQFGAYIIDFFATLASYVGIGGGGGFSRGVGMGALSSSRGGGFASLGAPPVQGLGSRGQGPIGGATVINNFTAPPIHIQNLNGSDEEQAKRIGNVIAREWMDEARRRASLRGIPLGVLPA